MKKVYRKTPQSMMFVVSVFVWFFFGPLYTIGITVSPDLGKRNSTLYKDYLTYNSSNNVNISLADRNRRLVPYMTFYVPGELPISQYYTIDMPEQQSQNNDNNDNNNSNNNNQQYQPPQQKQVIAIFASHPHSYNQQQNHVQPQHQQNYHNVRPTAVFASSKYPIQRPQQQFHSIMYGTRHQIPNKHFPNNNNNNNNHHHHQDHLSVPISFKQTIFKMPQQKQSSVRFNISPFRPENKVPGPFIPIVYPDPEIQNDKSKSHSSPSQNNDVSPNFFIQGGHTGEDDTRSHLPSLQIHTTSASTARPLYPILNEINIEPGQQQIQSKHPQTINYRTPSHEDHRQLTSEEKYVIYLEEQLLHKQQQQQQQQQQHLQKYQQQKHQNPIVSQSPSPQFIVVSSTVAPPLPDNQISYQDNPEKIDYKKLVPVPVYNQNEYNQAAQQNNHVNENQQNYIEYVEPEQHQQIIEIPANVHVSTRPPPIIASSIGPILMNHQSIESQRLKPIASLSANQHFYKQEKRPVYIQNQKPTIVPQIVRQHLTETTQVPLPTLTTYHPALTTLKPTYSSYYSSEKPLKLKPSQRYKPIIVTKPVPSVIPTRQPQPLSSSPTPLTYHVNEKPLPDFKSSSLADILKKLQDSNHLPQTLTPDNIDNSIRTLIKILNNLKQSQTIVENPPQHHDEDYEYDDAPPPQSGEPGPNSGRPGIDYPVLAEIPHTNFNCKEQRYKGFFGDPETNCQVWHYCDLNGGQASFLCPNGTIFSQVALTCDWWFNVKCSSTAQLYVLNERLYKYILPFTPKFPEDYSGPLVDKYLALKFKEMEEKMRKEKAKGKHSSEENSSNDDDDDDDDDEEDDKGDTEKENENTQNSTENSEKNNLKLSSDSNENFEEYPGSIDTGIPITMSTTNTQQSSSSIEQLTSIKPIIVTSTGSPFSSPSSSIISSSTPSSITKMRTSVESEKVEVIEIKTDGTSGHLIPDQTYSQHI